MKTQLLLLFILMMYNSTINAQCQCPTEDSAYTVINIPNDLTWNNTDETLAGYNLGVSPSAFKDTKVKIVGDGDVTLTINSSLALCGTSEMIIDGVNVVINGTLAQTDSSALLVTNSIVTTEGDVFNSANSTQCLKSVQLQIGESTTNTADMTNKGCQFFQYSCITSTDDIINEGNVIYYEVLVNFVNANGDWLNYQNQTFDNVVINSLKGDYLNTGMTNLANDLEIYNVAGYTEGNTTGLGLTNVYLNDTVETDVVCKDKLDAAAEIGVDVALSYFKAVNEGDTNYIEWETQSEINNDYFEVQSSRNGFDYETLETINGQGTTSQTHLYSMIDENPFRTTYYRLKQVDFDGSVEYSYVTVTNLRLGDYEGFNTYPNPVSRSLYIELPERTTTENVQVIDVFGKVVKTFNSGQISYDLSELNAGMYIIMVNTDKGNFSQLVNKQ